MKKIAVILMIVMLLQSACALAFSGSGYPAWDGASTPGEGFGGKFGDDALQLEFDPDPVYSYTADGVLTACFFAFDAAEQNYLELFLVLPEDVRAGSTYTSADPGDVSSVSLYEVFREGETLYFAGQLMGIPYPGGTDYEIRIDSAVQEGGKLSVSGSLSATLCKIEDSYITDDLLSLSEAAFQFTLSLQDEPAQSLPSQAPAQPSESPEPIQPKSSQAPAPEKSPVPKFPGYTMDPHPAFTLPPDYRVI